MASFLNVSEFPATADSQHSNTKNEFLVAVSAEITVEDPSTNDNSNFQPHKPWEEPLYFITACRFLFSSFFSTTIIINSIFNVKPDPYNIHSLRLSLNISPWFSSFIQFSPSFSPSLPRSLLSIQTRMGIFNEAHIPICVPASLDCNLRWSCSDLMDVRRLN